MFMVNLCFLLAFGFFKLKTQASAALPEPERLRAVQILHAKIEGAVGTSEEARDALNQLAHISATGEQSITLLEGSLRPTTNNGIWLSALNLWAITLAFFWPKKQHSL